VFEAVLDTKRTHVNERSNVRAILRFLLLNTFNFIDEVPLDGQSSSCPEDLQVKSNSNVIY